MQFADRLNNVETSAIRELFKLLGKPGIISFAGGFPDSAMFDVEGIRAHIGADSMAYLSLAGMNAAIHEHIPSPQNGDAGHCTACFSGVYPINIPAWLFRDDRDKLVFEETWG